MTEADTHERMAQRVTDALLLFFEGGAIELEVRMDAVTDLLATLIDGDAERFDRCLDRLSRKIDGLKP
jgi:hypothetical protein